MLLGALYVALSVAVMNVNEHFKHAPNYIIYTNLLQ
jgi:hypothetical protein